MKKKVFIYSSYFLLFILALILLINPSSATIPKHEYGRQFYFPLQVDNYHSYSVQSGDTLYMIAQRFGVSLSELRRVNNKWDNSLNIGEKLIIPTRRTTYTVQVNDSLYTIARKFGITVSQLQNTNNLNSNYIWPGQTLTIPLTGDQQATIPNNMTIVVDAGHGGSDPGAVTYYNSRLVKESDIAFDVANRLITLLNEAGYNVINTRNGDYNVSLWRRVQRAYQNNADLFVSIHVDNSPNFPGTRGSNVYISPGANWNTYQLANTVQINLERSTGRPTNNMGRVLRRGFTVLYQSRPAILVELGFLSNWSDLSRFQTPQFRYLLARGIFNGIENWVN